VGGDPTLLRLPLMASLLGTAIFGIVLFSNPGNWEEALGYLEQAHVNPRLPPLLDTHTHTHNGINLCPARERWEFSSALVCQVRI
jgi:hypothetical protein